MNRFSSLKGRRALIPFFMLGDPNLEASFALIKVAIDAGADALELGIPFSDPLADGPIIQRAAERALQHTKYKEVLQLLAKIRAYTDIPIGVLTYCNPLWHRGMAHAVAEISAAGVDAILIADLSWENAEEYKMIFAMHHLGQIFLLAPNTDAARANLIHQSSTGFTYVVNVMGTTGLREGVPPFTLARLKQLKSLAAEAPLVVGFGIQNAEQVRALWDAGADGVIIGSKFIQIIEKYLDEPMAAAVEIKALIKSCKAET